MRSMMTTSSKRYGKKYSGRNKTVSEELWEAQKEIQRIHKEVIIPDLESQLNEDFISVSFSKEELKKLDEFIAMFAYE